ncbi:thioredoxin reductase [Spiroplasma sp. TIUS-1]|uniref:thioredoxin-disulfide reductase n=1 Tax=Spiroplasma sp. TIUS-1 TaxID=216963 RepID=UPI0013982D98|nr:thioredoxin-disulfide reductase [Spiroplasma sp. TIUS-1]QHX35615.1 thioredoxin reductase [Spiroplasma sp. TIUS-1]
MNKKFDIIIAGAGPAGLSAAIYAARAEMNVAVLERSTPGGKVMKTAEVENYPGFNTILGPELGIKFFEQAMNLGANFIYAGLKSFKKENDTFIVTLENGEVIESKALIIATGSKENLIGVPGEVELYGKGVSYCAACDAAFHKGKEVVVVGGGYSAIEEAIFLTRFVNKVYLVHRRQEFRADKKSVDKAKANPKIEFILDSVVTKINGTNKVETVDVKSLITNDIKTIPVSAIFPFIGQTAESKFIEDEKLMNSDKNIIVNEKMETTVKGLWSAGDVRVTPFRQIATAVADGALAGQEAVKYLELLD